MGWPAPEQATPPIPLVLAAPFCSARVLESQLLGIFPVPAWVLPPLEVLPDSSGQVAFSYAFIILRICPQDSYISSCLYAGFLEGWVTSLSFCFQHL